MGSWLTDPGSAQPAGSLSAIRRRRPPDASGARLSASTEQADLDRHALLSHGVEARLGVANEQIEGHGWSLKYVEPCGGLATRRPPSTRRTARQRRWPECQFRETPAALDPDARSHPTTNDGVGGQRTPAMRVTERGAAFIERHHGQPRDWADAAIQVERSGHARRRRLPGARRFLGRREGPRHGPPSDA